MMSVSHLGLVGFGACGIIDNRGAGALSIG